MPLLVSASHGVPAQAVQVAGMVWKAVEADSGGSSQGVVEICDSLPEEDSADSNESL